MPSLENRKTVACSSAIGRPTSCWAIVRTTITRPSVHRRDPGRHGSRRRGAVLHAGHTSDAANPVYMYYSDAFLKPYPFDPTLVVPIDDSAEKKWQCISAMPSQFGDKDSWQGRTLPGVPQDDAGRQTYLLEQVRATQRSHRRQIPRTPDCPLRPGAWVEGPLCGSIRALAVRTAGARRGAEGDVSEIERVRGRTPNPNPKLTTRVRESLHAFRIPADWLAFEVAVVGEQRGRGGAEAEDGILGDRLA